MGLSLEQKQTVVSEIAGELAGAQAVIVAEYRGLNVGVLTDLRAKARKSGVYLRKLSVSSTMGIGVKVDPASVGAQG